MTADDMRAARRRVKAVTGWVAATATILTAGFALGAARHATAKGTTAKAATTTSPTPAPAQVDAQSYDNQLQAPSSAPSASYAPPAATSGGS
jgi:hypothetical protein